MNKRIKTIKMFECNGAWYVATSYGRKLIRSAGIRSYGGFLSLTALANDVARHGITIKAVPK